MLSLQLGVPGGPELLIILLVLVLFFGAPLLLVLVAVVLLRQRRSDRVEDLEARIAELEAELQARREE